MANLNGWWSWGPRTSRGLPSGVCVTVTVRIPMLPDFIDANTGTGEFLVERDGYIDG